MACQGPKEILSILLQKVLQERLEKLETHFKKEESDMAVMGAALDAMRKSIKGYNVNSHMHDWSSESQIRNTEDSKKGNTISNTGIGTSRKEPSLIRDKSAEKPEESKTVTGLTRYKTALTIKPLKKEDEKEKNNSTMSKIKTTQPLEIKTPISKTSRETKTPVKNHIRTTAQTPTKKTLTSSKSVEPLKDDKRHIKKQAQEDKKQPQGVRVTLIKSHTKGELLKKEKIEIDETRHHNRLENFSGVIGEVIKSNDELLTKAEYPGLTDIAPIPMAPLIPKIDYFEILDDRWADFLNYLNRNDQIKIIMVNKVLARHTIKNLITGLHKEIISTEGQLKAIHDKHPKEELTKDIPLFTLSKGAVKAIELLNEEMYYKLFVGNSTPGDDAIVIYRVLLQLMNSQREISSISSNGDFWALARKYFIEASGGKMGNLMSMTVKSFDFSNENIYRVGRLVAPHLKKIIPTFFTKTCPTTGLVTFLVKDALEYAGIVQDKKTPVRRIDSNIQYSLEKLHEKIERMKGIQMKYLGIA